MKTTNMRPLLWMRNNNMPRYEYKCTNDKCEVDIYSEYLPMKEYNKKTKCPECKEVGQKQFGCQIDKFAASKWRMDQN